MLQLRREPAPAGAKPRTSTTSGYPNVLYWCTNTSALGGIVFPAGQRICYKSLDGGTSWGSQFTLLSKPTANFAACTGRGEMFDALDGYYPTADAAGRLYLPVRCGPTTEYIEGPPTSNPAFVMTSADEGSTWQQVADLPPLPKGYGEPAGVAYKEELRADRLGNLYLVRGTGEPTGALFLWVSKDRGKHWSASRKITIPGTYSVDAPLWQIALGAPGHLAVGYAGKQGSSQQLNAYLIDTRDALAPNPTFRGAAITDPKGEVHLVNQLAAYDYTDIEIAPDGVAHAAYPFGLVGRLANLPSSTGRLPSGSSGGASGGASGGSSGGLATTGYPFVAALAGLLLLAAGFRLRSVARRRLDMR